MNAKPTIVFVHGAFADSSSWAGVITNLQPEGYPMIALANPLRGVQADTEYLVSLLRTIDGPIVLVGHSYGGMIITNAADGSSNVIGLVYVAAFAPENGESAAGLSGLYPGSTLGPTLNAISLPDGGKDLYIQPDKFWKQFAADVPEEQATVMAATQRPITEASLNDPASLASWKNIPSWFIYGDADKNIPAASLRFMAERANGLKIIEIEGASHTPMLMHPEATADLIREAINVGMVAQPE